MDRIVYEDNGKVKIEIPSPEYKGTMNELAQMLGLSDYDIVSVTDLPASRNYRDAWKKDLSIDIDGAKEIQKKLMAKKALERIEPDMYGERDLAQVKQEIETLQADLDAATTLTEVYNIFPASIERRKEPREYKVRRD